MQESPNLALPYIMPAQAQSHVTHDEALRRLDCMVQMTVLDRTRQTPPPAPAEGDRYIVAQGATGAWATRDGQVAAFQDGVWAYYAPSPGWTAWNRAEAAFVHFDGSDRAAPDGQRDPSA